jgi:hypothetical protein
VGLQSRELGEVGLAEEEVIESRRSKLVPYGLLSSSSFHMSPAEEEQANKRTRLHVSRLVRSSPQTSRQGRDGGTDQLTIKGR